MAVTAVAKMAKKRILIIGAGLAGLAAALETAQNGGEAVLVSTQPSERAQSNMAEGGINAALNTKGEDDSPAQHAQDTFRAGCGLADYGALSAMTEAAPGIVRRLYAMGAQFNMAGGDIDLRSFGGQKKKRTAFAQSSTGKQVTTALIDAARRCEAEGSITRLAHHEFVTLLLGGDACGGAVVRERFGGTWVTIPSDAVIMACGGPHGLFPDSTGSLANTGEAAAELFRLGLPFADLEFIQYHPTTFSASGKRHLVSEAARGEGGRLFCLREGQKWYFMEEKYPELGNLMPRDITAREIFAALRDGPVFLDLTELPAAVMERKLRGVVDTCLTYMRLDPRCEPIPVEPGLHYFMGGIRADSAHRTGITNLYAAGECCSFYHGANRLGGNSLLGALYGGALAARTALAEAERPANAAPPAPAEPASPAARQTVRAMTRACLGVVRDRTTMENGLDRLDGLAGSVPLLARAMLKSALAREESRGAHYRSDFPDRDDARFRANSAVYADGTEIRVTFEPVKEAQNA